MEEKEKSFLEISPYEHDYRLLVADKLLTEMSPEIRMDIFKKMFLTAVKAYNDEVSTQLIYIIGREYSIKEKKIADETDKHYGNAAQRANDGFGDYLRNIYWELPDKKQSGTQWSDFHFKQMPIYHSTLLKTKARIIEICVRHWANHYYKRVSENNLQIFKFVIDAYFGAKMTRYIAKEEKEEILRFLREATNHSFTPEILEKWLELPNTPEEIRKIFIIARARNGGTKLVERDMKNAEILKPLDVENRSRAALEFHKKFCADLAKIDNKIGWLVSEISKGPLQKADKIDIRYDGLNDVKLVIYFRKGELHFNAERLSGLWAESPTHQLIRDIRDFFLKYYPDRSCVNVVNINFVFYDGDYCQSAHKFEVCSD